MRIIHCPQDIGGNPQQLARAERQLGLQSHAVSLRQNYMAYPTDEVLCQPADSIIRNELARLTLLRRALRDYDIIHFNNGRTTTPSHISRLAWAEERHPSWLYPVYRVYQRLLSMRDLPLLKRAGKGIVVTFQGNDARQGDFCLENFEISAAHEAAPGFYNATSDAERRKRISRFARYADRIYALNPDLLHVLPERAEFLPYANVDLCDWRPVTNVNTERLTVVHAPTRQRIKGTEHVLRAVERLRTDDQLDFEFVLVQGLTHAEARRIYTRADLLVDQLLVGWYGGVAVECMALGKPVLCYLREADLAYIPEPMRRELPIIRATPTTIYDVLKTWLTVRKTQLPELGHRSRAYVERWHDPRRIAVRLHEAYEAIMPGKADPSRKEREARAI